MKGISVSVLALALTAAAGSAIAAQDYGSRYDNRNDGRYNNAVSQPRSDIATVISAQPLYGNGNGYADNGYQRQECWNEQTNNYDDGYYRDSNGRLYRNGSNGRDSNANGTLIGALIGGALGNQAGKGDGRKAATVGGAVIGGLIGNNMDRNRDAGGNYDQYRDNSGVVRRCRMVNDNQGSQLSGYSVTYRYAGDDDEVFLLGARENLNEGDGPAPTNSRALYFEAAMLPPMPRLLTTSPNTWPLTSTTASLPVTLTSLTPSTTLPTAATRPSLPPPSRSARARADHGRHARADDPRRRIAGTRKPIDAEARLGTPFSGLGSATRQGGDRHRRRQRHRPRRRRALRPRRCRRGDFLSMRT